VLAKHPQIARKNRVFATSVAVIAAVVASRTASAQATGAPHPSPGERTGRTSALSWVRLPGADGCIGAPALAASVEARLGRRVFVAPADAEISVEGTVAYRADTKRFKATFRVADRGGAVLGVRDVEESVSSCDKLDERFAFVLSVLIDPEAALGPAPLPAPTGDGANVPARSEAAPPPAAKPEASPAAPSVAPDEPWRWLAGADFGGAAGLVPDVGWVLSGSALLTPPHWPGLRAKGSSYLPTSQRIEGVARAEIGLVTGEIGICPLQIRRAPFGITVCLGGLLGELSARGTGFSDSRGYSTLLGGIVLDVVGELAVTRAVILTLSPAFVVPLSRARLAYDDAVGDRRTIFEVAPVGGSIALGIAVGSR
jgi:hypothetical protein